MAMERGDVRRVASLAQEINPSSQKCIVFWGFLCYNILRDTDVLLENGHQEMNTVVKLPKQKED